MDDKIIKDRLIELVIAFNTDCKLNLNEENSIDEIKRELESVYDCVLSQISNYKKLFVE